MHSSEVRTPVKPRRGYRSVRRQQQAAATRGRIVAAARTLFVERGYVATTVESIADAAGVAVATLYASVGGKRGILWALLDALAARVDVERRFAELVADPEPRRRLERLARIHLDYAAQLADIEGALRAAAALDTDVADAWGEGEERRLRDCQLVARSLARDGALHPGLDERAASEVLWLMTGPDTHRHLVVERGWAAEAYERWLARSLVALLLG